MYVIIAVDYDLKVQDSGLSVALYSAFQEKGWDTEKRIPFLFFKHFTEPKEFIEKQLDSWITEIAGQADVEAFHYAAIYSDGKPNVHKTK